VNAHRTRFLGGGLPISGGAGRFFVHVIDDEGSLIKQNFRLRTISLCDRSFPGLGIETLGGLTALPKINASSGLIVSVQVIFPDEIGDAS
jgi:hypothetical protein